MLFERFFQFLFEKYGNKTTSFNKIIFTYTFNTNETILPPVPISFEVEPQLEYIVMELTPKPSLVGILPLPVHYLEGNVFVWRTSMKSQNGKLLVFRTWRLKKIKVLYSCFLKNKRKSGKFLT